MGLTIPNPNLVYHYPAGFPVIQQYGRRHTSASQIPVPPNFQTGPPVHNGIGESQPGRRTSHIVRDAWILASKHHCTIYLLSLTHQCTLLFLLTRNCPTPANWWTQTPLAAVARLVVVGYNAFVWTTPLVNVAVVFEQGNAPVLAHDDPEHTQYTCSRAAVVEELVT